MPYADPEKGKASCRAYYATHRDALLSKQKEYAAKNKAGIREKGRIYCAENKAEIRARRRAARHAKKNDPNYRLRLNLRGRIWKVLCGLNKSAKTLELIGCSLEFLWERLEKQFQPGMTRENYGPVWHVDHILPCSEFHLQHSEEQEVCFHWTNLQPLFASDNRSKSDKII